MSKKYAEFGRTLCRMVRFGIFAASVFQTEPEKQNYR